MARKGIGFFDTKGHFFKSPEEATVSDIASLLGKVGEGESLAPGIAHMGHDKKMDRGNLPFVLMRDIGDAFLAHDVDIADVSAFLDEEMQAH